MANKRKLAYIAGFIAICWTASAALVGVFHVLADFLKSSTAAVTLFLVILYSCIFGLLGWQAYEWKGKRDGWPSVGARARSRKRVTGTTRGQADLADEEPESGWKRS